MKKCLIGYTGFVGSNLTKQLLFDDFYNSKNINEIVGKEYDQIICAGIRAEKYLANKYPEKDLEAINSLIKVLETVKCNKFVLISTIDVYDRPVDVDEDSFINENVLKPYGKNRLYMEKWVSKQFNNHTIVRLPALFGYGLKKNFIYDCMTKIPAMIMAAKYNELAKQDVEGIIKKCYKEDANGNFVFNKNTSESDRTDLVAILEKLGFTSLVFTDSRSIFPFYYLKHLGEHINIAIENNIKLINFATEPVSAKEIADRVFRIDFNNVNPNKEPANYNFRTKHFELYNGKDGYIFEKETVYEQLSNYVGEVK